MRFSSVRVRLLATGVGAALLLTACTGEDDPRDTGDPTTATQDEQGPSSGPVQTTAGPDTSGATSAAAAPAVLGLAPVPCEEAEREPSELEASLLVEPGERSGADFDAADVLAAVEAQDPSTPADWATLIRAQTQGDYAETVCQVMTFSSAIGDGAAGPTEGTPDEQVPGANHFAIVLDASGSMEADAGGETRMEAAKSAIEGFVKQIPKSSTISLRVYGHEGNNKEGGKAESCASSEVVYEGPADPAALGPAMDPVGPVGWTPLAKAIGDAEGDIPEDASDAIVYVVTDGKETCGGDPVAAARSLAGAGVEPVVNVVGFQAGDADQEALRAIAKAGGGDYTRADSAADLEAYWAKEYQRMARAWAEWRQKETQRITGAGQSNTSLSFKLARTIDQEASAEYDRMSSVITLMRQQSTVPSQDVNQIWTLLRDKNSEIDAYGSQTRRANFDAAIGEWRTRWQEAYDTGSAKWTDYYEKARGN